MVHPNQGLRTKGAHKGVRFGEIAAKLLQDQGDDHWRYRVQLQTTKPRFAAQANQAAPIFANILRVPHGSRS